MIARWTIGSTLTTGIRILEESVRLFDSLYKLKKYICYNNIKLSKIQHLSKYGVKFVNQHLHPAPIYESVNETWKYRPARLNIDSHEIFIDNDLVITSKIPKIDQFLQTNRSLMLKGRRRYYGKYDHLIDKNLKINTGIFGLPPYFDLEKEMKEICKFDSINKWVQNREKGLFDDQGIITACLQKLNPIIINENEIFNYDCNFEEKPDDAVVGFHFINANRTTHKGWIDYVNNKCKLL